MHAWLQYETRYQILEEEEEEELRQQREIMLPALEAELNAIRQQSEVLPALEAELNALLADDGQQQRR